ncbi:hypothetical protein NC652_040000 [Populus alba x Populus x berolinensis]|nr:hypothetical protein NC652_040000 [Populus alba x Populus x berolinensis]
MAMFGVSLFWKPQGSCNGSEFLSFSYLNGGNYGESINLLELCLSPSLPVISPSRASDQHLHGTSNYPVLARPSQNQ